MKTEGEETRLPVVPNPYLHIRSQEMNVQCETESSGTDGTSDGWHRITLMVSPDGNDFRSIDGDYAPNPYGQDQAPIADGIVRKWYRAYQSRRLPWWRRDNHGWPIERYMGRPVKSFVRMVCQNIRKITG